MLHIRIARENSHLLNVRSIHMYVYLKQYISITFPHDNVILIYSLPKQDLHNY